MRPMCRHCGAKKVNRPRGMCWDCYYTPGVRELYPITSKYASRGFGLGHRHRPPPAEPTTARPGTPEKVAVLLQRARDGVHLWHPDDVTG